MLHTYSLYIYIPAHMDERSFLAYILPHIVMVAIAPYQTTPRRRQSAAAACLPACLTWLHQDVRFVRGFMLVYA